MAKFGQVEHFDASLCSWSSYEERLASFLRANHVPETDQVDAFLSLIGPTTYNLLKSLTAPQLPVTKSFDELTQLLRDHLEPKPSVIAERARFHRRIQEEGETIAQFVAALRTLARTCDFGTFLDESLRDRFVCGMRRVDIQRALFAEDKTLTFQKAVDRAVALETAIKSTSEVHGSGGNSDQVESASVHKLKGDKEDTKKRGVACYRCGSSKHLARTCIHSEATCYKCQKVGHIQRACRSFQKRKPQGREKSLKTLTVTKDAHVNRITAPKDQPLTVEVLVENSPVTMEIDTGAAVSVISKQQYRERFAALNLKPTALRLKTYTGETVKPCGVLEVKVSHQEETRVLPLYVLNQSGPPLLGREWLQRLRLNWKQVTGFNNLQRSTQGASLMPVDKLQVLLDRYQAIFKDELGKISGEEARLFLKEGSHHKFLKARSVPFALVPAVEKELSNLEALGVITPTTSSEFATPLVPVPKKDGTIRLCCDYKMTLNPMLDVERYPLPRVDELFSVLAGGQSFSKIDLNRAYQQVVMSEESRRLLTITTHKGLYLMNRLPFGIASAPAIFQREMDNMLKGIPGVACYLDEVLITGKSQEEHLRSLEEVFKRFAERGVRIKREKCAFFQDQLQYLGHVISPEGIRTSEEKVAAIVKAPAPADVSQLRSLLGAVNYYGKFVPQLATIVAPLYKLPHQDVKWQWDRTCQEAFQRVKKLLMSSEVLVHYDPTAPLQLACDASSYGVGAVLSHILEDGTARPVAYASRTLTSAEKGYSQLEKEALALLFGVKKFHFYLYGRTFKLVTDHKPLQTIFGPKTGIPAMAAARLQRWPVTLSAYRYSLVFKRSTENVEADCFSRLPVEGRQESDEKVESFCSLRLLSLPVDSRDIARETARDPLLRRVYDYVLKGWPPYVGDQALKPWFQRNTELSAQQGCLMLGLRVVVPEKLRSVLLDEIHEGHPGVVRAKELARSSFWWPSVDQDVENHVKACEQCQQQRNLPTQAPLHPWSWPTKPWQRVHVDYAGPFRGAMFLVIVDAHSKWPEVFIMQATTSAKTIEKLQEVFARFGMPETLVSDNGTQFTSNEFKDFLKRIGTRHVLTAPYHPSSNGPAERFVQTLKSALRKGVASEPLQQTLGKFLQTYRNIPHATTGEAPAVLFLGRRLRTRLDVLKPSVENRVARHQFRQMLQRSCRTREFKIKDRVRVWNPHRGDKWLKATILSRSGPVSYKLRVYRDHDTAIWRRHQDHIRQEGDQEVGTPASREEDGASFIPQALSTASQAQPPPASPPTSASTDPGSTSISRPRTPTQRYPTRVRCPPDRYSPGD
ncbi:uncharacterized protein ISCGN_005253 [Ixodes scapularis]